MKHDNGIGYPLSEREIERVLDKLYMMRKPTTLWGKLTFRLNMPESYSYAICANLDNCIPNLILHRLWAEWPLYSGDAQFPVPHPLHNSPYYAFIKCKKWKGQYGENRFALVKYLIDRFEGMLEEVRANDTM